MDDIEEKFDSFFKYLNRESVYEGGLSTLFSDVTQELIFKRPLERKHNKDAPIPRNYLSQYITPFIDYMFRDINAYLYKFDKITAKKNFRWALEYWRKEREAQLTDNKNKCRSCEYNKSCTKK